MIASTQLTCAAIPTGEMSSGAASAIRWHIHPNAIHLHKELHTLAIDEWLKDGRAHIVKQGPHRVVYRLSLAGETFYLKRHLMPDLLTKVRQWIRPTKAYMEYERALCVATRGIATLQPAAWGKGQGSESYLLTRGLEDVVPLSQWLTKRLPQFPQREQARRRLRMTDELARFIARVHAAGITHHDLHAGNILLREHDVRTEFFLVDLDAVRVGAPLRAHAQWANLAVLHLWFLARTGRTDRLRFLRAYLAHSGHADPAGDARRLADRLQTVVWNHARAFWLDRDERCTSTNRYYQRVRRGAVAGHALRGFDPHVLASLLADPDEPFRRPDAAVLKESKSSKIITLELDIDGMRRAFVYKRFTCKSVWKSLARLLRPSPALHSWIQGHGFHERGLPSARPLVVLERRPRGLVGDGYLLMEKIEDAVDLHAFLQRLEALPARPRRRTLRDAIERIGRVLSMMHQRHYTHRDLKANNILVRDPVLPAAETFPIELEEGGMVLRMPRDVWFIDLVGARLANPTVPMRRRNLARLAASFYTTGALTRSDRLRLLRAYLAARPMEWVGWKRWWRRIDCLAAQKIRLNERNGRSVG
jgi:tRNA A-37 threonylcarbamoyl transferase component Bud32